MSCVPPILIASTLNLDVVNESCMAVNLDSSVIQVGQVELQKLSQTTFPKKSESEWSTPLVSGSVNAGGVCPAVGYAKHDDAIIIMHPIKTNFFILPPFSFY
jgi:hypothetical protein